MQAHNVIHPGCRPAANPNRSFLAATGRSPPFVDNPNRVWKHMFTGTELARPFIPTKDFALSTRFYEALGFEKTLDGEVAIFRAGSGGFLLQRHFQEDWADNFMMQLMVDDLDAWWSHIDSLDLPRHFGVPAPKPPAVPPWGLRIAYVVDPAGVLWHVAERRDGVGHDR
jgi:catechol 2,3-dioxygenase-like lactoylglutathione lyase family enzyme